MDRAVDVKVIDVDHGPLPVERVLGVQCCVQSDAFRFKISIQDRPLTRRGILSVVSSIYDPFGILAPVVPKAKLILQDLASRGLRVKFFLKNDQGMCGPRFLLVEEPLLTDPGSSEEQDDPEVKMKVLAYAVSSKEVDTVSKLLSRTKAQ